MEPISAPGSTPTVMIPAAIKASSRVRPSSWSRRGRASAHASESVTERPSTERLITTVSMAVVKSVAIRVMSVDGAL